MEGTQQSRDGEASPGYRRPVHLKKSASPNPSSVSVRSEGSLNAPPSFQNKSTPTDFGRPVHPGKSVSPNPSSVSVRSEGSLNAPPSFQNESTPTDFGRTKRKRSVSLEASSLLQVGDKRRSSCSRRPVHPERSVSPNPSSVSVRSEGSLNAPPSFQNKSAPTDFRRTKRKRSHSQETSCLLQFGDERSDSQHANNELKSNLQRRFRCLYEGTVTQGKPMLLNEIYTDLYITESESGEISSEHEVRQIETQSRRAATEDTAIKCSDIFSPLPGSIRTVLTKGVAGIGKTVSVQKFILDWTEGKENQDVQLIFPLPFREINLMKDKTLSLSDLLQSFFPEAKEIDLSSYEDKIVFIFDGLDECRLSLDFQSGVRLCDVTESASLDVLLTNLIMGNLLPSAQIWITSRPAAADLIPSEFVHRVTEVRGFNDPQKEEYFRKKIRNRSLAKRIISHLKSSRSLYIMCHIPVFCWISATVLEKMMSGAQTGEIPKTLTQMYTHFLIIQTNIRQEKDYVNKVQDEEDMIVKLGKLAFQQLVKGHLIFYEEDLRECGIDEKEALVYSGLCTQIFREELGLHWGKVYCFVHLSIQEHQAALYVHLSFTKHNINVFDEYTDATRAKKSVSLSDLHKRAVDEALQSQNGHLDLLLRFLLGLSLETNQALLKQLMTNTRRNPYSEEEIVKYIKMRISNTSSPEKSINLFHCLNELGDHSLVQKIQQYLKSGKIREARLSSSQWSALVFVLLTTTEKMDVFVLNQFIGQQNSADEVLQKLLPVIKESRSAEFRGCGVTDVGCADIASVLGSNPSHLRELCVSKNKLGNLGVKELCAGLENPHCKLEQLSLWGCGITHEGCVALASALRSNPSHLTLLDLSWNKLGDSGVKNLCAGLENVKLGTLRLIDCGVTPEGCAALAFILTSNPSHLRHLFLSMNELGDSGLKKLCAGLEKPYCELETLWFRGCGVTDDGFGALASALKLNPSHLTELFVSDNPGVSGMELLSALKKDPHYKLKTLL